MRPPRKDWKATQIMWDAVAVLGDGKRCYQLSDRTVAMLLSQTEQLHWATRWYRETPFTEAEIDQIEAWASKAESELMKDSDCVECDDDDCIVYPLNASRIEWLPSDPFVEPNRVPPEYLLPPWYIADAFDVVGASPGDVTTDLAHIPVGGALPPYDRFPRFRLKVQGAVRVQIYLVTVLLGGLAQIQVDGDLGLLSYIDLNADTISLPPEASGGEVIWEHEFNVDGEHFIDLTMIPWIDESSTPIRFGGAVRKIVICGDQSLELCPDCPDPEPCPECEDCEDCEDYIEDEFCLDEDEIHMLLDCYKHSVGDIKMSAIPTMSGGWLPCDGSMHSKLEYPELAAALAGLTDSTETEFATPDFSLRSPMGTGFSEDFLALQPLMAAGALKHQLTAAEMPEHDHDMGSHTHTVPAHSHNIGSHMHEVGGHTHPSPAHTHNLSVSSHTHGLPNVTVGARSNSAAGSGQRLMRSNATGTQDDIDIAQPNSAAQSLSISSDSVSVQANTPFNTSAASGSTDNSAVLTTSAASGTSGSAGGDESHANVHPVLGVLFYIFAGCAISSEDCL